jgi:hypothetical protein
MKMNLKSNKKSVGFLLVGVIFFLMFPFVSCVIIDDSTLGSDLVLNTSATNSSMTFSVNISVDRVTIESDNITLENITCLNTGYNYGNFSWDTLNANKDSLELCPRLDITLEDYYALNSTLGRVDNFNSSTLEEIEFFELNFSINSSEIIDDWYLNFTANGTNACSLGNKQSSVCYYYNNDTYKWIQFINNTNTITYDGTQGNQGDRIIVTQTGSGGDVNLSFRIDEHYNPNVFKWYDALYNFSDVKWQNATNQRITKQNMIKVELNQSLIPLNADQYKLDFRVEHTNPDLPLETYACNSSYVSGHPHDTASCVQIVQKYVGELQDVGTKFRGIFTDNLIDEIGDMKYIIIYTLEQNESKYYAIKSYKATAPTYTTHWEYSNNNGTLWNNLGDGYETELNINWFYDGAEPTAFVYSLWTNTTNGTENFLEGNITWNIDPVNNYPPLADLKSPLPQEEISLPYNVTFTMADPNDDNLNASLLLYQSGVLNKTIVTNMNQSNESYYWVDPTLEGIYDLVFKVCELNTTDLFCSNHTHEITIDNTDPFIKIESPLNQSYDNVITLIHLL